MAASDPSATRPPRTLSPVAYLVAAGVVALVAVLVAGVFFVLRHGGSGSSAGGVPASGPLPAQYSQVPSTDVFAPVNQRSADNTPLTLAQAFSSKTVSVVPAKATLRLSASKLDSTCASAVWGKSLSASLNRWGCSQAARGMYTDKNFTAMVTIFNLANVQDANALVGFITPKSNNGFPRPLSGSFGQAFSTARGLAMGHYAQVTWVQRAGGTGNEQDTQMLSLLIKLGVSPAILSRVAGKS